MLELLSKVILLKVVNYSHVIEVFAFLGLEHMSQLFLNHVMLLLLIPLKPL